MGKRGFRVIDGGRNWSGPSAYQPRRPIKKQGWLRYAGLWIGAILVGLAVGVEPSLIGQSTSKPRTIQSFVAGQGVRAHFGFCHTGGGYNCVVDGDTLWIEGVNVRIAEIDAPETHEYRCLYEKQLGDRATQELIGLVNSGTVTLLRIDRDEDRYGRKLRIVKVDGVSVGETLVNDGLARWYEGGKRPWC
jgi:endonuclease YncB( thermonuclease family)